MIHSIHLHKWFIIIPTKPQLSSSITFNNKIYLQIYLNSQTNIYNYKFVKPMLSQSMLGSNYPTDNPFSSSKKKTSTPALIFFKSQKDTKNI